jgi:hypothetical protein
MHYRKWSFSLEILLTKNHFDVNNFSCKSFKYAEIKRATLELQIKVVENV